MLRQFGSFKSSFFTLDRSDAIFYFGLLSASARFVTK